VTEDAQQEPRDPGPRPGRVRLRSGFVRLWAADTISQFGTRVTQVALPLAAIGTAGPSASELGLLRAAGTVPFLLFGLHAGAWVDRVRRRPLMVASDWGRAVLLATVPLAAAVASVALWHLYLVAFGTGVLTVCFDVAYQSYLPGLVEEDQLVDANGKLQATAAVAEATGPGLGGVLVQALTAPVALLVDAVSFVGSALLLAGTRAAEPPPDRPSEHRSLRQEIATGLRFVLGEPVLRRILVSSALINLAAAAIEVVLLLFLVRDLGQSAGAVGVALSAGGVGAVLGALLAPWTSRRLGDGPALWLSLAVTSPFGLLIPLAQPDDALLLIVPAMIVTVAGLVVYDIVQLSFRQALTPPRLQGRVHATVRFVVWGSLPIGSVLGGLLAGAVGNRTALWLLTAATVLIPLILFLSPVRTRRTLLPPR
jgi:MFS family permease